MNKKSNNNITITVRQSFEYRPCIQNIYDEGAFFYPQYVQAAQCIDEITTHMYRFQKEQSLLSRQYEKPIKEYENDIMGYPNNIIGFCARRGQGKTSAMLSVIDGLNWDKQRENKNEPRVKAFWDKIQQKQQDYYKLDKKVYETKYYAIDPIDPTTMERNESVLEIIIARLLEKAEIHRRKRNEVYGNQEKEEMYQDLLGRFQKVYHQFRKIKHSKVTDEYDDLTNIMEIGDSRSAKKAFLEMIHNFLEYVNSDMLVIPVDDSDLNPERAYEIVEDLRKYCVLPRVMVLMAVHLGTMRYCIEQDYVKKYIFLLHNGYETNHMEKNRCRELAERYIDKLIPGLHQIHLPYVGDKMRDGERKLLLKYILEDKDFDCPEKNLITYDHLSDGYHDIIARLIYEKTGVILIENPDNLHYFIPNRMRDLVHMLAFLSKMSDIGISGKYSLDKLIQYAYFKETLDLSDQETADIEECLDTRIHNMDQLEVYFFQHWCPLTLTKYQRDKLMQLQNIPLSLRNKRVIEILYDYCFRELKDNLRQEEKEEYPFADPHQTVTYGDVVDALSTAKKYMGSDSNYKFIYAIQMYYTICMNKILCLSLKNTEHYFENLYLLTGGMLFSLKPKKSFIRRKSVLNNMPNIKSRMISSWLIPCDQNGIVQNTSMEWTPEVDGGVFTDHNVQYVRFDPCRLLLIQISKDFISDARSQIKEKNVPHNKIEESVAMMAESLQYITNYDLQYRARKNKLSRINYEENLIDSIRKTYEIIHDIVRGESQEEKKEKKQEEKQIHHRLPINCCEGNILLNNVSGKTLVDYRVDEILNILRTNSEILKSFIASCEDYCKSWSTKSDESSGMESVRVYLNNIMNFCALYPAFNTLFKDIEENRELFYQKAKEIVQSKEIIYRKLREENNGDIFLSQKNSISNILQLKSAQDRKILRYKSNTQGRKNKSSKQRRNSKSNKKNRRRR